MKHSKFYLMINKTNCLRLVIYILMGILLISLIILGVYIRYYKSDESDINIEATPIMIMTEISYEILVYSHEDNQMFNMDLEEYVVCSVAAEMPASFDEEALKAQAVACRTLAYSLIGTKNSCKGSDICTESSHSQGCAALDERKKMWGNEYDVWQTKIEKAVNDTKGMIIVYNDSPIDVFYHASSNGKTEDVINVFFESRPYLVSVSSPDKGLTEDYKHYTTESFVSFINNIYKGADIKAKDIKEQVFIHSYTASGRVDKIRLGGVLVDGVDFRRNMGLKSTAFMIEFDDGVSLYTDGYGHGVGMSQRGANEMAKNNNTYQEILSHYYKGIQLKSIS